jgi:hypothetical protein
MSFISLSYTLVSYFVCSNTFQVRAAEDLLKLTRELKEYWLMEPLRELNEGEKETAAKMTEDAARVAELFEKFGKKMHLMNRKATESENIEGSEKKEKKKSKKEKAQRGED